MIQKVHDIYVGKQDINLTDRGDNKLALCAFETVFMELRHVKHLRDVLTQWLELRELPIEEYK